MPRAVMNRRATPVKILVISLAGIGDTLIATPLLRELRANFPAAKIEVLVFWPGARDLLRGHPCVDTVHQKDLVKAGALSALRFVLSLRGRYDISLNTHPQSRIHYRAVAWLIGARLRASHEYDHSGRIDRWLINRSIPQDYGIHSVENNLRLLPLIGARPQCPDASLELSLSVDETGWASSFLKDHSLIGRRWIGIHAGSGTTKNLRYKRWPLAHYQALMDQAAGELSDVPIVLFGGPDEAGDNARLLSTSGGSRLIDARTPSVRHAAALLQRCPVFLSVDNLMMHLAAAAQVPGQIVIESPTYGPTLAPYRRPFTLVPNPVAHGRNLDFYRYDGGPIRGTPEALVKCMESVTVDAVFSALRDVLAKTPPRV